MPLLPYTIPLLPIDRFASSIALTLFALFAVGASRALIANVRWWKAGLEMLGLGAVVAALAYGSGAIVAALVDRVCEHRAHAAQAETETRSGRRKPFGAPGRASVRSADVFNLIVMENKHAGWSAHRGRDGTGGRGNR